MGKGPPRVRDFGASLTAKPALGGCGTAAEHLESKKRLILFVLLATYGVQTQAAAYRRD